MNIYAAGAIIIVMLASLVGLQSKRLSDANEENGKLESAIDRKQAEYDALREAADNQALSRDKALKEYKQSLKRSERQNKALSDALEEASKNDEEISKCMRVIISDTVFSQLP